MKIPKLNKMSIFLILGIILATYLKLFNSPPPDKKIEAQYEEVQVFDRGLASVRLEHFFYQREGYIDKKGDFIKSRIKWYKFGNF